MIKRVVECDHCHKQEPIHIYSVFGYELPKTWYIVRRGTSDDAKHYCSRQCMVKAGMAKEGKRK